MYQNAGNTPGGRQVLGIILIIAMILMAWLILRNNDVFGEDKNWEAFKNRWYVPLTPIVDSLNKSGETKGYTVTTCKEIVDSVWVCPKHGVIKRHFLQLNEPEGCISSISIFHYESDLASLWGRQFCLKCWRENLPIEQVFANQIHYVAAEDSNNIFYTSTKSNLNWKNPRKADVDTLGERQHRNIIHYRQQYFCPRCGTVFVGLKELEKIVEY